jgi:uncharacterized cysteine cluster protein YcgN (CxxCxxCC family)
MTEDRLKAKELQEARDIILDLQDGLCALCDLSLYENPQEACLDHDHVTGMTRGVLCRNCNSMEGKVHNCSRRAKRAGTPLQWLKKVVHYMEHHQNNPSGIYHPTYRTSDEKRIRRNKRARKRRLQKKKDKWEEF